MKLDSHLEDPAVAFVKRLLPSAVVEPDTNPEPGTVGPSYRIDLFLPAGADYRFTLWLGSGEKQISARLLTEDEATYFWYMPFEKSEFRSEDQLNKAFLDAVELIVRHNTHIEQKRGLFFNSFQCEYESVDGWKRISGVSALRWIRVPKTPGKQRVYHSPPLVSVV